VIKGDEFIRALEAVDDPELIGLGLFCPVCARNEPIQDMVFDGGWVCCSCHTRKEIVA